MYRITIFHYHLQTGGITQVIGDSVLSLLCEAPDLFEITIVSGRQNHTREFVDRLNGQLEKRGISSRATGDIFPLIDYVDDMDTIPDTDIIKKELLKKYGGTVWWVHNYHIGKNPLFTEALLEITKEKPEQQIVFHIHDFPEGGRFSNLKRVRERIRGPLYPDCPNVRYVGINERDRDILVNAGLTEERVFLLNNPIRPGETGFIDFRQVHDKINRWAIRSLPYWHEGGKLILYPVRTIRRKNVLEAALLVNLLDTPANLVVTLPGRSSQEKRYSDLVERAFSEKLIPGAWAAGTRLEEFETSFTELTRASDLIISSSVQEGFGYLFINSLLWSVPLIARNLDILDGIRDLFSSEESCFYDRIMVPIEEEIAEELEASYSTSIDAVTETLPKEVLTGLREEVDYLLQQKLIDFSFLTPHRQYRLLQKLHDSADYLVGLREMNAEIVATTEKLMREARVRDNRDVFKFFGPPAHTERIIEILNSFFSPPPGEGSPCPQVGTPVKYSEISYKILKFFSHIDYFRPLYF